MTDSRPPLAKLATDALANERIQLVEPSPMQRARAIALLAATIEDEARVRRRRRLVVGLGVAAAAAAAIVTVGTMRARHTPTSVAPPPVVASAPAITGSAHTLSGDVSLVHEGKETKLDGAASIESGDHVVAATDARAAITLSTGTHLVVQAGGDLGVVEQDDTQIYGLQSGAVQADVAKLETGQRFLIRTRDVEVEVRGTSFELSVVPADPTCGGGTTTRLVVSEGLVLVRNAGVETNVGAGDVWPRGCGKAAANEVPEPAPTAVTPNVAPAPKAALAPDGAPTTAKEIAASELAAQNDLFAQATGKKNAGDVAGAVAGYERYLAKYPGGPLAESATVERMRLLASIDPGRGAVAAKAYLARYPNGFDRAEAERLASGAP